MRTLDWYHTECYHLQGKTSLFVVGAGDLRVRGYHLMKSAAVCLRQALSAADAEARAREFLHEHGIPILPSMRRTRCELAAIGVARGSFTLEWRGFDGEVRLPDFYEVTVSSSTGVVTDFVMCDVRVTVATQPEVTVPRAIEIALNAIGTKQDVARVNDLGLSVWVRPSGEQFLCRCIDLLGSKTALGVVPHSRVTVDAHTGKVLSVARAN